MYHARMNEQQVGTMHAERRMRALCEPLAGPCYMHLHVRMCMRMHCVSLWRWPLPLAISLLKASTVSTIVMSKHTVKMAIALGSDHVWAKLRGSDHMICGAQGW